MSLPATPTELPLRSPGSYVHNPYGAPEEQRQPSVTPDNLSQSEGAAPPVTPMHCRTEPAHISAQSTPKPECSPRSVGGSFTDTSEATTDDQRRDVKAPDWWTQNGAANVCLTSRPPRSRRRDSGHDLRSMQARQPPRCTQGLPRRPPCPAPGAGQPHGPAVRQVIYGGGMRRVPPPTTVRPPPPRTEFTTHSPLSATFGAPPVSPGTPLIHLAPQALPFPPADHGMHMPAPEQMQWQVSMQPTPGHAPPMGLGPLVPSPLYDAHCDQAPVPPLAGGGYACYTHQSPSPPAPPTSPP
eukprot:TRINITY_DN47231_c0_g1_i4.p1 TRINITY_DN47231_c0_g1~~TRINITY_DN47231_c0_g1_i4.p1  ORF type:complete len:297 (+),score=32.02 TRINITY_DN47231_c0_g1_i4:58-948(+)